MKCFETIKFDPDNKNHIESINMSSIEETIQLARLQQAANSPSLYERKQNQKALKVLTVAAYILFVSMAAIILSFYYVFIWDPTSKQISAPITTTNNCDSSKRIVIPENIAIRLANSSEVPAEYFFRNLYERYQRLQKEEIRARKSGSNSETIATSKSLFKPQENNASDNKHKIISSSENVSTMKQITPLPQNPTATNNPVSAVQYKEKTAYVDDEDLETDYDQSETSGANRIQPNDTSIIYQFDTVND